MYLFYRGILYSIIKKSLFSIWIDDIEKSPMHLLVVVTSNLNTKNYLLRFFLSYVYLKIILLCNSFWYLKWYILSELWHLFGKLQIISKNQLNARYNWTLSGLFIWRSLHEYFISFLILIYIKPLTYVSKKKNKITRVKSLSVDNMLV